MGDGEPGGVAEVRAELRAHRSALNALAATQSDFRREMRAGFAAVDVQFRGVNAELKELKVGISAIVGLLEREGPGD